MTFPPYTDWVRQWDLSTVIRPLILGPRFLPNAHQRPLLKTFTTSTTPKVGLGIFFFMPS